MELNKELYKRTFSRLKLSQNAREELSAMTETTKKPRRKVFRTLLVTAVVMALAVAVAMGANAATNGELYEATLGNWIGTFTLDNGAVVDFYQTTEDGEIGIALVREEGSQENSGTSEDGIDTDGAVVTEQEFSVETDGNKAVIYDSDGNVVSTPEE